MNITTSRRMVIGSVAAMAVTAAVPTAVIAHQQASVPSSELPALIAAYDAADVEWSRYAEEHSEPVEKQYQATVSKVPHTEIDNPTGPRLSTANHGQVERAMWAAHRPAANSEGASAEHAAQRKLAAAALWRKRAVARIDRETGYSATLDHDSLLLGRVMSALDAIAAHVPRDFADLAVKSAKLKRAGWRFDDIDLGTLLAADIARIAEGHS